MVIVPISLFRETIRHDRSGNLKHIFAAGESMTPSVVSSQVANFIIEKLKIYGSRRESTPYRNSGKSRI
jgi:hypothetical protein